MRVLLLEVKWGGVLWIRPLWFPGRVLLSRAAYGHSTIGAEGLNCRVRDGNGCYTFAMATGNLYALTLSGKSQYSTTERRDFKHGFRTMPAIGSLHLRVRCSNRRAPLSNH